MTHPKPDVAFTVSLTADRMLTEAGHEKLADAIDAADLPAVLHDAVVEALGKILPDWEGGGPDREPMWMDWYTLTVEPAP